jgi:hypothetical protein
MAEEKVAVSEWEDLEGDWRLLQRSPIQVVTNRASDLKSQLEVAGEKTVFELRQHFKQYQDAPLTVDLLSTLVGKAVRVFLAKWQEGLRDQNLAGLIEIVLEGQDLTPEEMRGFLKALPDSLLQKILDSGIHSQSATGVHGLIAIEKHLRQRKVLDYTIGKDLGRVYVEFVDPETNGTVRFSLDEFFKV